MERVILLMGNTGGGKSTLSNSLIGKKNIFKESDNMKSQTKDCQIAEGYLFGDDSKPKIKVIDTPGFMDSSGDDDNTFFSIYDMLQNIKDTGLHLILYCLPATDLRCHKGIIDSIKQIQNLMSNEVSTRIFVVVTQLNKLRQEDLDEKCQRIKHEVPQILGDAGLQLNFDKILFYHHGQENNNFDIEILLQNDNAFIPEILEDLKKCYDPNDKEGQLKHFTQQNKQIQMLLQQLENQNNERKLKEQQDQERFQILYESFKLQKEEFELVKKEMIERFNREINELHEEQRYIIKRMSTDQQFRQQLIEKNLKKQIDKRKHQVPCEIMNYEKEQKILYELQQQEKQKPMKQAQQSDYQKIQQIMEQMKRDHENYKQQFKNCFQALQDIQNKQNQKSYQDQQFDSARDINQINQQQPKSPFQSMFFSYFDADKRNKVIDYGLNAEAKEMQHVQEDEKKQKKEYIQYLHDTRPWIFGKEKHNEFIKFLIEDY